MQVYFDIIYGILSSCLLMEYFIMPSAGENSAWKTHFRQFVQCSFLFAHLNTYCEKGQGYLIQTLELFYQSKLDGKMTKLEFQGFIIKNMFFRDIWTSLSFLVYILQTNCQKSLQSPHQFLKMLIPYPHRLVNRVDMMDFDIFYSLFGRFVPFCWMFLIRY